MSNILMDTHTLLWLVTGNKRLGKKALSMIDAALKQEALYVSAISFWEIALLIRRGKISLAQALPQWRHSLLAFGVKEYSVDGQIGIDSIYLEELHADPADRFIMTSAYTIGATLITADKEILGWKGAVKRHNAEK